MVETVELGTSSCSMPAGAGDRIHHFGEVAACPRIEVVLSAKTAQAEQRVAALSISAAALNLGRRLVDTAPRVDLLLGK